MSSLASSIASSPAIKTLPHPYFNHPDQFSESMISKLSKVDATLNILVIGEKGVGKSAILSTIISSLQSYRTDVVADPFKMGITTKEVKVLSLQNNPKIKLWDSWALTEKIEDSYGEDGIGLKQLLNGQIKKPSDKPQEMPKPEDRVHGVFVVIDPNMDKDSPILETINKCTRIMLEMGYRPRVILNKIDDMDVKLAADSNAAYWSEDLQESLKKYSDLTGYSMNHILPCKTNHNDLCRRRETDVLPLFALTQILDVAKMKLSEMKQEYKE